MAERKQMALASKLVRRTTLNNDPGLIQSVKGIIDSQGYSAAVDHLVNGQIDTSTIPYSKGDGSKSIDGYMSWWFDKIQQPSNPVQEKMTFFWHTILTSHRGAGGGDRRELVAMQMNKMRQGALTDYRSLLHTFVNDGLLMRYLNATTNHKGKINENLARELMELFTTGIGPYSETDIREAAKAMSGWDLNPDNVARYNPEKAHGGSVRFMGVTKRWDVTSITDRLLDHPQTAKRIAGLLWHDLVGNNRAPGTLGGEWMKQRYDIRWLLRRILNSSDFTKGHHYVRPRSGFEYYTNLCRVMDFPTSDVWRPRNLGQLPWEPPNVAGWDGGTRWLDSGALLSRVHQMQVNFEDVPGGKSASTEEVLDRCSIFEVSNSTMAALRRAETANIGDTSKPQLRYMIALSSPESNLT